MSTLILIRHGQSLWNAENRFTGWVDSPLSERGRFEARQGGQRLASEGLHVDRAFASTLIRAVDTGRIVLDTLGQDDLEQEQAWELNERFYGALTGKNRDETQEKFGVEQVHRWRRSYDVAPPGGESLRDTTERTLPYFTAVIAPAIRDHEVVVVSAHGNSLRSIVKELDRLDDDAITRVDLATGVPIVYELEEGCSVGKRVLD